MRHAFDRSVASVRSYDRDGRLHLASATISKAQVSQYMGAEIPEAFALGLVMDRTYRLLRPARELAKAAPTLIGCPVLKQHVAVDVDDHQPDAVVGAVMSDVHFVNPLLLASVVVWAADAIAGIEDGSCASISAGYRYDADMTPGPGFDGVMRDLSFNHVALVEAGRIGPDAVIGDARRSQRSKIFKTEARSGRARIARQLFQPVA
jgi:uncharacterized protein